MTRADAVLALAITACIFSAIATLVFTLVSMFSAHENRQYKARYREEEPFYINWARPWIKPSVITLIISLILSVGVPDTKTLAAIYLLPKIAQNEDVAKLPATTARFLNAKLEEWIQDSLSEKQKSKKDNTP